MKDPAWGMPAVRLIDIRIGLYSVITLALLVAGLLCWQVQQAEPFRELGRSGKLEPSELDNTDSNETHHGGASYSLQHQYRGL